MSSTYKGSVRHRIALMHAMATIPCVQLLHVASFVAVAQGQPTATLPLHRSEVLPNELAHREIPRGIRCQYSLHIQRRSTSSRAKEKGDSPDTADLHLAAARFLPDVIPARLQCCWAFVLKTILTTRYHPTTRKNSPYR